MNVLIFFPVEPHADVIEHGRAVCHFNAYALGDEAVVELVENLQCAAAGLYQKHARQHHAALQIAWRNALVELYGAPRERLSGAEKQQLDALLKRAIVFNSVAW